MNKPLTKKQWEQSVAEAWSTAIEATYKDMIDGAVKEEREECAKLCEFYAKKISEGSIAGKALIATAFEIRARGEV